MKRLSITVGLLSLLAAVANCGATNDVRVEARGPSNFQISEVTAAASGDKASVLGSLTLSDDEPVLVSLSPDIKSGIMDGFEIEPPGGCADTSLDCGWIVVSVLVGKDPDQKNVLTTQAIQSPVLVKLPASARPTDKNPVVSVTLRAQLSDAYGNAVHNDKGDDLQDDFVLELKKTAN